MGYVLCAIILVSCSTCDIGHIWNCSCVRECIHLVDCIAKGTFKGWRVKNFAGEV
jgi:hypothetical protein